MQHYSIVDTLHAYKEYSAGIDKIKYLCASPMPRMQKIAVNSPCSGVEQSDSNKVKSRKGKFPQQLNLHHEKGLEYLYGFVHWPGEWGLTLTYSDMLEQGCT